MSSKNSGKVVTTEETKTSVRKVRYSETDQVHELDTAADYSYDGNDDDDDVMLKAGSNNSAVEPSSSTSGNKHGHHHHHQHNKQERKNSSGSNDLASKFSAGPDQHKVSTKSMQKKADQLKKKSGRQHSKSCSGNSHLQSDTTIIVDRALSNSKSQNKDLVIDSLRRSGAILTNKNTGNNKRHNNNIKGGNGLRWGRPGDEDEAVAVLDENDPNYDSEEDPTRKTFYRNYSPASGDHNNDAFEQLFNNWIAEYFVHEDVQEVCNSLYEWVPSREQLCRIPYLAISVAVDKKLLEKELISRLLSGICDGARITHDIMQQGFDKLLVEELNDMILDSPEAADLVGKFIARAIADDVLPPKFVQQYDLNNDDNTISVAAKESIRVARAMTNRPHCWELLDNIWLNRSGDNVLLGEKHLLPNKVLTREFRYILKEYLSAKDINEVFHRVKDLDVPHFHHELVYSGLEEVITVANMAICEEIHKLFEELTSGGVFTTEQMAIGVRRIFKDLPDLAIDSPTAYLCVDRFLKFSRNSNFLTPELLKEMPSKVNRSRFISECHPGTLQSPAANKSSRDV